MSYASKPLKFLSMAIVIAAWGCSSDPADESPVSDIPDECNPLGGTSCIAPWPSSAYLVEADTATGYRLDLPPAAMPVNFNEIPVDPTPFNRFDGFGATGAIIAMFPNGVSSDNLPPHIDPGASLEANSATVLLNMETGERHLHFAEIDMNPVYAEDRALLIRPLERLQPATRYAVAIRSTVKDADGLDLPISDAFQALRDGTSYDHPLMDRLAPRYDAIFDALENDGVTRDELVLAWDFVTASDEFLLNDLLTMREQALPMMNAESTFTAAEIPANPEYVHRAFTGTHQAPNFLSDGEEDESVLVRDADGNPSMDGMFDANFAAIIPECVNNPETELPLPVIIFGHGLFGTGAGYLDDSLVQRIANQFCFVVLAGDFIGLSERQLTTVVHLANDLNLINTLTDKLAQSVINFIALEHMVRNVFESDPMFQFEGQSVMDPSMMFYLGGSLGGIMGGVFMAYDPYITRGALGVPGGAWGLLFERSLAWGALQLVAYSSYKDVTEQPLLVAMLALRLEPVDPATTAPRVIHDPLPDTPAKQILMYMAMGDSLVSNLSTEFMARSMDIPVVGPSLYVPEGLTESTEPLANGFTIYDEHPDPLPPMTNVPPLDDNGTHGGVNGRQAILRQVEQFFFDGYIVNTCFTDGDPVPCDCATGACD